MGSPGSRNSWSKLWTVATSNPRNQRYQGAEWMPKWMSGCLWIWTKFSLTPLGKENNDMISQRLSSFQTPPSVQLKRENQMIASGPAGGEMFMPLNSCCSYHIIPYWIIDACLFFRLNSHFYMHLMLPSVIPLKNMQRPFLDCFVVNAQYRLLIDCQLLPCL